jgi:4-amino-4-deoxy-L-arabinose transferase-like glycosyltransferase
VTHGGFPQFNGLRFFLHGPGFFYLEAGWARLLGGQHSLVGWVYEMRTLNAVLAAATAVVIVLLAARAASPWTGAAAGLLFALDPFCIRQNDRVLLETAMMLFVLLGYLAFTSLMMPSRSLTGRSLPFFPRSPSRGAAARAVGAGLLFGCAVLTKDEAALLTLLPLLVAAALRWGPGRVLTMFTVGATVLPYLVYLSVVAANGHIHALWVAKTVGLQRILGLIQVTGFHSRGGGSLSARIIEQGPYFATTYLALAVGVPTMLFVLRRGGQLPRLLGLLYCAAALALGYGLILGTLEEQELYLLIVPSLLMITVAASLWRGARLARRRPAGRARPAMWTRLTARTAGCGLLTTTLMLVLSINVMTSVQWLRQPDDGVAHLLSYMAAHVPVHARISDAGGTDTVFYALAGQYDLWPWETPAAGFRERVSYVVVPWAEIERGYTHLTPSDVRHLVGRGRMVFSFHGRSFGDLELYQLPSGAGKR